MGDLVTIVSRIPASRSTDYQVNGDFRPLVVNDDLDRTVSLVKQVEDLGNRSILTPECQQGPKPLTLPVPSSGLFLKWKSDLTGLENTGAPAIISPAVEFNVVADMLAATNLNVGDIVQTAGYTAKGDGGDNQYEIVAAATGTDDGGSFIDLDPHQAKGLFPLGSISVRQFGAVLDGIADDTVEFTATAAYMATVDFNTLLIPSDKIDFTSEIDVNGATIIGQDTVITGGGTIVGHQQLVGIQVNGFRQDLQNNYMKETAPSTPKLIAKAAADEYYVLTSGKGVVGGTCFKLRKDVVTASGSLGGSAELLRNTRVMNCVGLYGWRKDADTETGSWSDHTVSASDVGHSGANVFRNVTARKTSTTNDTTEFVITVPQDGKFNVAIYGTAGSTVSFDILIDGVVDKTLDPRTWANDIYAIQMTAAPGTRTIKIDNTGASGTLYVVGINYHRISEVIPGNDYDDYAVYRDANEPYYIVDDTSANDYAIEEKSGGLLGGSFHGGETVSTIEFVLDGIGQTITTDDVVCRTDFYIRQISLIDWTGGITMSIESLQIFRDGQHEMQFAGDGSNLQARTIFAGMSAINETFDRVVFPVSEAIPATGDVFLGQSNKVIMREPTSDAIAITDVSLSPNEDSVKGGLRIQSIAGSYNKVYYNPVSLGDRTIDKLSFVTVRTFK